MENVNSHFGKGIAEVRKLRGISQAHLSALAGLSKATICQLESGRRGVSEESLALICNSLNVPVSFVAVLSDKATNSTTSQMAGLVQQFLRKDSANTPGTKPNVRL
jgi:transcriptional regulator with XRE-family HTH domain